MKDEVFTLPLALPLPCRYVAPPLSRAKPNSISQKANPFETDDVNPFAEVNAYSAPHPLCPPSKGISDLTIQIIFSNNIFSYLNAISTQPPSGRPG